MASNRDLLSMIIQRWNLPPEGRESAHKDLDYCRDPRTNAANVLQTLLTEFSAVEIQDQLTQFLAVVCAIHERGAVPNPRDMVLADCCLRLVLNDAGISLPTELAQRIVRSFESVIWYPLVGELIRKRLTDREVLEALLEGLTGPYPVEVQASCLEGIRLYHGQGRNDPDRAKTQHILGALQQRLDDLSGQGNGMLRELVPPAQAVLIRYS